MSCCRQLPCLASQAAAESVGTARHSMTQHGAAWSMKTQHNQWVLEALPLAAHACFRQAVTSNKTNIKHILKPPACVPCPLLQPCSRPTCWRPCTHPPSCGQHPGRLSPAMFEQADRETSQQARFDPVHISLAAVMVLLLAAGHSNTTQNPNKSQAP